MWMPVSGHCRSNPMESPVDISNFSFRDGFQTPGGLEKARAHSYGRHLKPIT